MCVRVYLYIDSRALLLAKVLRGRRIVVVNTFLKAHLAKVEAREYRYFLAVTCKVMSIELDARPRRASA